VGVVVQVEELREELRSKEEELEALRGTTPAQMWLKCVYTSANPPTTCRRQGC
jgi:hypothetical protein